MLVWSTLKMTFVLRMSVIIPWAQPGNFFGHTLLG